jgi:hypothetical protein
MGTFIRANIVRINISELINHYLSDDKPGEAIMPKFCTNCGKPMEFENAEICPGCGIRFQPSLSSSQEKKPKPWIAVLLSFFFVGWGQWYNGRRRDGLKFLGAYLGTFLLLGIFAITVPNQVLFTQVIVVILFGIWVYCMYDAYKISKKINRGELEFSRKSRLFWLPVGLIVLGVYVVIMAIILAAAFVGMPQSSQSYTPSTYPPIHPYTPLPTPIQIPYIPVKIPTVPAYVPIKIPTIAPYRPVSIPTIAPVRPIPSIAPYRPMRY